MSGNFFTETGAPTSSMGTLSGEITPYLEALVTRLRKTDFANEANSPLNWNMIDRVVAYAASAEQHIAEQQQRIRELEDMSTTDELTGLNNRRALKTFLTRSLSSARRYGDMGIVAFLDLDNFKEVNDTLGHDVGDMVLRELSKILGDNLRETDFVARLGGDEFVFVLEKADTTYGLKRAAEIRDIICQSEIKLRHAKIQLSASMGLAIYNENSSYEGVLKSADRAMYADKKFRKNL